jgi:soluble lytic murein transglycosylase
MPSRSTTAVLALTLAFGLAGGGCAQTAAPDAARSADTGEVLGSVNAVTQNVDYTVDARDALRRRDGVRLAALRDISAAQRHPLASWIDYWELGNRLATAQQSDLDAFYQRWPATYVEDRLRNDWLLELGKRRDWVNFAREFPRFRMNDDREVTCYALLVEHQTAQQAGKPVPSGLKARAFAAWVAQRDLDDGCNLMATTLHADKVFGNDDAWLRARLAAAGREEIARHDWPRLAAKLLEQLGLGAGVPAPPGAAAGRVYRPSASSVHASRPSCR